MNAIQEEAEKYAMHYVKDFVPSVLRKETSFREHYERLDFNRSFFEGILYTNIAISNEFSEKRNTFYRQSLNEKELDALIEKEEMLFLKQIAREFKAHFSAFYIEEVNSQLEDVEEELKWVKADIRYHEHREYIRDKAIVGEVSEEERTSSIDEGREKTMDLEEKRRKLLYVKKEMEQLHVKA